MRLCDKYGHYVFDEATPPAKARPAAAAAAARAARDAKPMHTRIRGVW